MSLRLARTADGRRLEVTREIDAPPETLWELLVDTTQWPAWGPSVRDVDCQDRRIRSGSTGRVQIPGGLWLPFEIRAFSPLSADPRAGDSGRWTWRVARVPATGHRVDIRDGQPAVVFELPLAAAGYAPVCRRALARIEELARQSA
jgi:hypothetical protein